MEVNWKLYQTLSTRSKRALKNPLDYGRGQRKGYPYSPRKILVKRLTGELSISENQVKKDLKRLRIYFLKEQGYTEEEIANYGISLQ